MLNFDQNVVAAFASILTGDSGSVRMPVGQRPLGRPMLLGADLTTYLLIGFGAFLGANLRFIVGGWAAAQLGPEFPYGTLIINVTGSFVIGVFLTLLTGRLPLPFAARLFFAVGFLGGYTTFSSFTFETLTLILAKSYLAAAINAVGSVILGLIAVGLGVIVGRLL